MIQRTFQFLPGVGPWKEKDLWASGIQTWDDFPNAGSPVLSSKADPVARERLALAAEALKRRDLGALASMFPAREHWRLYSEFASEAVFFDIEAVDSRSREITVVSLYSESAGLQTFIRGRNLEAVPQALARHRLWVTFNGSCFDVPTLEARFEEFPKPEAHIDLRFVTQRFGPKGGLKDIEDQLGLARPLHLRGVHGYDASRLWGAYQATTDVDALRLLVEYNLYDAFQLRSVMDAVWNRALSELNLDEPRRSVFDRGELLYDLSKLLLELHPPTAPPSFAAISR